MSGELAVEFDATVHSLAVMNAAAYRLIGVASCQIERSENKFICRLTPSETSVKGSPPSLEAIKARYIDLVTDEALRERLSQQTEPMRNLILSLAFGSLVAETRDK